MSEILQWVMAGLALFGFVSIWRMDAATRSARRIQQAQRRNMAEYGRVVRNLSEHASDLGNLNQERAELNARYDETITRVRAMFGIEDAK